MRREKSCLVSNGKWYEGGARAPRLDAMAGCGVWTSGIGEVKPRARERQPDGGGGGS